MAGDDIILFDRKNKHIGISERYYFFLAVLEAISISFARSRRTLRDLLDILAAMMSLLVDTRTLKNKLYAVLLILCTLPVAFLDGDATATVSYR